MCSSWTEPAASLKSSKSTTREDISVMTVHMAFACRVFDRIMLTAQPKLPVTPTNVNIDKMYASREVNGSLRGHCDIDVGPRSGSYFQAFLLY